MKDFIRLAMLSALVIFGLMAISIVAVEVYDRIRGMRAGKRRRKK